MSTMPQLSNDGTILTIQVPFKLERHGSRKIILTPDGSPWHSYAQQPNNILIKAIARAHRWRRMLEIGEFQTLQDLANHEKINKSYLSRVIRLTLLAPNVIEAILNGNQPPKLQLRDLLKPFPLIWAEQEKLFPTPA